MMSEQFCFRVGIRVDGGSAAERAVKASGTAIGRGRTADSAVRALGTVLNGGTK